MDGWPRVQPIQNSSFQAYYKLQYDMKAYILKKNVLVHDWAPHPEAKVTGSNYRKNLSINLYRKLSESGTLVALSIILI
jgi:CHAD domain-containing protein